MGIIQKGHHIQMPVAVATGSGITVEPKIIKEILLELYDRVPTLIISSVILVRVCRV